VLTVEKLVQYTKAYNPLIIKRAQNVSVQSLDVVEGEDEDGDPCRDVVAICKGETVPRTVIFRFYGTRNKNTLAWVSCDCEYFLYHCEVALQKKGSTDVIYSNGARPKITNPRMLAAVCKHCIAVLLAGAHTAKPAKTRKKLEQKRHSRLHRTK
jgi:hypothetical protein